MTLTALRAASLRRLRSTQLYPTTPVAIPVLAMDLWTLTALVVALTVLMWAISEPAGGALNWYLGVVWCLYAPLGAMGVAGVLLHRRGRPFQRSEYTGRTDMQVIFTVPSLCHPQTVNALRRVVLSIARHAPANLSSWRVDVVTEEDNATPSLISELVALPNVRVVVVPSAYRTPTGASFKTRANHYAMEQRRRDGENTLSAYVYHLDDDTHVGRDTVASIAEFIETHHGRRYLAQGILAFPRELTTSTLAWYCDAIRPADDATRFALFTGWMGRPLGGLHGEHLIIRADIEDEIGWDFRDTVIEDAYFALEFAIRYPGRSTTLNSFSYGASPSSVSELVKQRRRWCEGLLRLICKRSLPWRVKAPLAYSVITWAMAPFQFIGLIMIIAVLSGASVAPPFDWLTPIWAFGLGSLMWQYSQGVKFNMAASAQQGSTWWRAALCVPGIYVFFVIETCGVVLGWIRFLGFGRQKTSEVIAKPL